MMKRTVLLLLAAICGVFTAAAQDVIVKTDEAKVEAKVTEITPQELRYKRFSNIEGPTYVLPLTDIWYIQYANGEKEFFTQPAPAAETIPATPLTPAKTVIPAIPLTPATPAYESKTYKVGELYDKDGVKGVVCQVSEDGLHGMILSLDQIYLHWSSFRKPDLRIAGADNRTDGQTNMEAVERYIAQNNLSWADFPAFEWCREKGEGWYLPSIDELLTIGHNYNGGTRMANNRQARNGFNDTLKGNGGERMDRLVYYFSSTEKDDKEAFTSHMGLEPPYVIEIPKYNKFLVRAVRKF